MECEDVRKRLEDFLDGEAEGAERTAIQDHLAKCPDCAGVARQLERLSGLLQAWKPAEAPAGLYERLKAGMGSRESWWRKALTPAFAGKAALRFAEVAVIAFITLAVSRYFQKSGPAQPDDDLAAINFYMTEHREAVLQAASAVPAVRQPERVTFNRDEIMYYEFIDEYRGISRPGVILRAPSTAPQTEAAAPAPPPAIPGAKALTLSEARNAVGFDPVAPSRVHPGYILDGVTKVAGRESLHLLYTNGVDTLSVFEQPLGGDQGLAARDFREYAVFKSAASGASADAPGNQGGMTILAWKNTHVSFVLIGRAELSRLMEIAQAFTDASKDINN